MSTVVVLILLQFYNSLCILAISSCHCFIWIMLLLLFILTRAEQIKNSVRFG